MKIVSARRLVFALIVVALLAVGCTSAPVPAPTEAPAAPTVAATSVPPAVPTQAATSQTIDQWADLFVVKPAEEQVVKVDPGNTSATVLWLKKKPLGGTPLYMAPVAADAAALRAAASNPYTLAFAVIAFGVYYISQNKPAVGDWMSYQAGATTINLTPLLPASLQALLKVSGQYNVTVNGKSVTLVRNYVSPDAVYTVVAKGQTVLASWQVIKAIATANPTGGITFKTGVGDVTAELTKTTPGSSKPPDQCSWYWTVKVPTLKNTISVCFDDLLPFVEALKNGILPPGFS